MLGTRGHVAPPPRFLGTDRHELDYNDDNQVIDYVTNVYDPPGEGIQMGCQGDLIEYRGNHSAQNAGYLVYHREQKYCPKPNGGGNNLVYCGPTIPAAPETCPADIDGDDSVGFSDLLGLLTAWGPCP